MRQSLLVLGLLIGCGGGNDTTPVTELSDQSQQTLCENFLDDICANPDFEGFCDDPCIDTGCPTAVTEGHIDAECNLAEDGGPITAQDVEDCGATGDLGTCLSGGGCMFDALEEACSGV